MYLNFIPSNGDLYIVLTLIITATCGDFLVSTSELQLSRAVFDNATHAIIGGLYWLIVSLHYRNHYASQTLVEIGVCVVVSSGIDLDHFFAAKSLQLKDAVNLPNRPPLHSSSVPLLIVIVLILLSYILQLKWLIRYSLVIFTAFASHHTRDATRRGYWFAPFGSTSPVPYVGYIILTIFVPYLVCLILKHLPIDRVYQYTSVNI